MTNVSERVSVEDYIAMRERAERAEAQAAEQDRWLMGLVATAASRRAARRAIEGLVAAAMRRNQPLQEGE